MSSKPKTFSEILGNMFYGCMNGEHKSRMEQFAPTAEAPDEYKDCGTLEDLKDPRLFCLYFLLREKEIQINELDGDILANQFPSYEYEELNLLRKFFEAALVYSLGLNPHMTHHFEIVRDYRVFVLTVPESVVHKLALVA